IFKSELEAITTTQASATLLEPTSINHPGSFGQDANVAGDFVVELTDKGPTGAPVAGTDVGGTGTKFGYVRVTLTSTAQIRPLVRPGVCKAGAAAVTGQQTMRAQAVVGPVMRNQ